MVNHPNRGQSQKPSQGRIVMYRQGNHDRPENDRSGAWPGTNGTRDQVAIITRVWSDTCVNLHVFLDASASVARCSVTELPDLPADTENVSGNSGWYWPPRA